MRRQVKSRRRTPALHRELEPAHAERRVRRRAVGSQKSRGHLQHAARIFLRRRKLKPLPRQLHILLQPLPPEGQPSEPNLPLRIFFPRDPLRPRHRLRRIALHADAPDIHVREDALRRPVAGLGGLLDERHRRGRTALRPPSFEIQNPQPQIRLGDPQRHGALVMRAGLGVALRQTRARFAQHSEPQVRHPHILVGGTLVPVGGLGLIPLPRRAIVKRQRELQLGVHRSGQRRSFQFRQRRRQSGRRPRPHDTRGQPQRCHRPKEERLRRASRCRMHASLWRMPPPASSAEPPPPHRFSFNNRSPAACSVAGFFAKLSRM